MSNEIVPVDPNEEGRIRVEMSELVDGIETLQRTIRGTLGAAGAITLIFMVGATFMEQSSTLVFMAILWSLFTLRLVVINRRSEIEKKIQESALAELETALQDLALPPGPTDDR